ncbi:MAG: tetratricopeptide repeat protein [Chloroflexi bacterium]|nr:tetratricopeptide repeat protein [Chloroflexota bacterium]
MVHSMGTMRRFHALASRHRTDFQATERWFTRALNLDNGYQLARFNRGVLRWRELDDWAGAIADFTTLLAQNSDYVDALFNRAMTYARAGNFHSAIEDFEHFLDSAPESRWARHAYNQLEGLYAIADDLAQPLPPPEPPLLLGP